MLLEKCHQAKQKIKILPASRDAKNFGIFIYVSTLVKCTYYMSNLCLVECLAFSYIC